MNLEMMDWQEKAGRIWCVMRGDPDYDALQEELYSVCAEAQAAKKWAKANEGGYTKHIKPLSEFMSAARLKVEGRKRRINHE